jgi:hypothetical protein
MDISDAPPMVRGPSNTSETTTEASTPFFHTHHRNDSRHSHFLLAHERSTKAHSEDPYHHIKGETRTAYLGWIPKIQAETDRALAQTRSSSEASSRLP